MYIQIAKSKTRLAIPIAILLVFAFFVGNSYGQGVTSFSRPAKVAIVSGDLQSGTTGEMLPEPFVVKLLDKDNIPAAFWNVTFTVISGGGKLSSGYIKPADEINVVTDFQGIAKANLTIGNTKTINEVEATFEDLTPVTFIATVDNTPPTLQPIGNKEVNEGVLLKFKASATDPDTDDTLTLSATPLPDNATFDPATGIFSFNPDYTQAGIYDVTFNVSDGFAEDSEKITITVKNVNQPPVLSPVGNRSVDEGSELAILLSANDPDGDALTYSALSMPTGATFDPATRIFRWTPDFNVAPVGGVKNFNVIFMVKDPVNASGSEEITITVNDVLPLVPDIRLLPITFDGQPSLDFGIVEVSGSSNRIFQIHNEGNAPLNISTIRTSDGQFRFISYLKTASPLIDAIDPLVLQLLDEGTITDYLNTNNNFTQVTTSPQNPLVTLNYPALNPGECLLIKAQFKPIVIGLRQANYVIESNDPDEAIVIMKVRGTATQTPDISALPTSIDFGDVQLGTSLTIPLKIYNDGNGELRINSITIDDPQFTVSQHTNVGAGSNITVNVKFTPTSIGEKTATLTINSNDPDEPIVLVPLKGNVFRLPTPDIAIAPTSINFGEVEVGKSSTKLFQISNTGDALLQITSITSSNSQFTVSGIGNVAIGSQITISVKFAPTSPGIKAALLTIKSNDPDESSVVVSIQGEGIVTPKPNISISPTTLDFGNIVLGNSLIKSFYIYNDGSATLQINSTTSNNTRFTILDNPTTVYPSGSTQVRIKFEPSSLGLTEGKITIASNDPDESSRQVNVKGTGVSPPSAHIRISPTSIDFGQVQVTKYLTREFKIYNDGTTTLTISNITSNNDQFIPIFVSTINISPSNYATATVRFVPASVGVKSGTISVASNDPNTLIKTLSVQGIGYVTTVPDIEVIPMVLDFGEIEVNQSVVSGFYIYNNGNEVLQISSITSNSTQFSITTSTNNVNPDYMAPVAVRFTPVSVGTKSGKITILSNDPDSPSVEVMVYGDGVYPGLPAIGFWNKVQQTSLIYDLYDVFFTDQNRGWVVGYNGTIARSINAGDSWTPQFSGTSRSLKGTFFTDSNSGWAVGQYGTILRTSNGGTNWSAFSVGIASSLESVVLTDSNRGWASGDTGAILRYNGINWSPQNSTTSFDLRDLDFVNSSQGWAVGNYGMILRTNNGGQTWVAQTTNTTSTLYGVDFINSSQGWAVGSNGVILYTQNGGQTWSPQNSNSNFATLTDVDFLNSSIGWVVGRNGVILYTYDGGTNWIRIDSGVNENLYAVHFIDPDNGWIVGTNGTILKYSSDYPSSITSVTIDGSPAHAGGTITITAIGQPRNDARFSIVGVMSNVSMTESPLGTYTGVYNVPENSTINIKDATVVVTLTNKYGEIATDSSKTVTIDTTSIIESASVTPNLAKAGDTIIITATGEPLGTARFTIENVASEVLMMETPYTSGKYIGEYKVREGTSVTDTKVTVKLTDNVGNVAIKEAGRITIDTVAQIGAITISGSPAGLGDTITVTMTGEASGTARFSIKDVSSSIAMTETSPGVYTGSYTVPQGIYAKNALVSVNLIDSIGNTATKDAGYITVDGLCKIDLVTIAGSPGRSGGKITVDIVGDPSGSAKFTIEGIIGENIMTETIVGSGKYTGSYSIPANVNAKNAVVTITLVDALGNIAVEVGRKVTIDNIVPEITSVEVIGSPGRIGGKITVNVIGEPEATAKFKIINIAEENMREQPVGSGKYTGSYAILGGINVQDATLTVTLIDSASNFAIDSSQKVTIDNTAPKISSVTVTGSPARVGGKIEVSLIGEANAIAKFKIGNVIDNAMTEDPDGSGKYFGSYTIPSNVNANDAIITVTLTDLAGNYSTDSSKSVTIDNTAPKFNSITVSGSPARAGETIIINVLSEPNAKANFKIDGVIDAEMPEQPIGSGKYVGTYKVPDVISVKDAVVTATLEDRAGNVATNSSQKVTIDSALPKIESVEIVGSPGRAGGKITVNLVGEPNASAKFKIGNIADENMREQPEGSGKYTGSYTILPDINVKDAVVTVTLIDAVGNISTDASKKATIDNKAPVITSVKVIGSPGYKGGKITIEMQGKANGKAVFSIAGVTSDQAMTEQSEGKYSGEYIIPDGVDVTDAVVTIKLTDLAGNSSTDKTQKVTIDTTAPEITSLNVSGSPAKIDETITITLIGEENGTAQFTIANVIENVTMTESSKTPGTYTGKYLVTEDKSAPNAKLTVTLKDSVGNVTTDASKNISIIPSWDVNRDGSVDVSDITAIANSFGQKVSADNEADVNGDGVVNVLDLAIVCKYFSQSQASAAPNRDFGKLNDGQLEVIKSLYNQVSDIPSNDPDILFAKELLGRIIAQNIPKIGQSQLLQNYPNPFNPETWIPFRLSKPGTVNISIYSASGQLVRKLDLGHKDVGNYSSRDKAIYWNGKNEAGEQVTSGIYFYSIKSGDFAATKKMIISR